MDKQHKHHCVFCHVTSDCTDENCVGMFNLMCDECAVTTNDGDARHFQDCEGCREIVRQRQGGHF